MFDFKLAIGRLLLQDNYCLSEEISLVLEELKCGSYQQKCCSTPKIGHHQ